MQRSSSVKRAILNRFSNNLVLQWMRCSAVVRDMVFRFKERYINLLTDFGFKRVFGTEANKQFTIDFLYQLRTLLNLRA